MPARINATDKLKGASRPATGPGKLTTLQTGFNKSVARDASKVVPAKVKAATGVRFKGKGRQVPRKQSPANRLKALNASVRTSNKGLGAKVVRAAKVLSMRSVLAGPIMQIAKNAASGKTMSRLEKKRKK